MTVAACLKLSRMMNIRLRNFILLVEKRISEIGKDPILKIFVTLVLFIALIVGLMGAILPWWIILMLLIPPVIVFAAFLLPELAIIGLLALLYGLLPVWISPQIPLGPGSIKTYEAALLLVVFIVLVRFARLPPLGIYWKWLKPVLLLMVLTVSGVIVANLLYDTPVKTALSEARNQLFWLLVFVVVYLVQTKCELKRLTMGIVFVALLISAFVIAQFLTGQSFIHLARVEDLVTLDQTNTDITRSLAGGGIYMIVFSILLLLARLMTRSISIPLALLALIILVASIVVTFGRGIWIATIFVSLVMAFQLMRWKGLVSVLIIVTVGISFALTLLAFIKPAVIDAAFDRARSTTHETFDENTTLGWRKDEAMFAKEHILMNPLFGIGLGTSYKPVERMNGWTVTESDQAMTHYIHNAYLGLWLKFGMMGLFAALWLSWNTFRRGRVMLRQSSDIKTKSLIAALIGGFMVPVITSFTQPEWLSHTGIGFFALMLGMLICIHRLMPSASSAPTTIISPVISRL